ncbi:MAG: LacI family DNA-binding transcriptional regulator [Anaerolineae bacterium]|nr:LacI family DNA-binding transcriptional regulator [Anaerolineae bacterium]
MPTVQDVARLAGVAPITVSRVVNDSGYVSEKTRRKVQAAIAELNYVPNTVARSLRLSRTHTLALVLTDIANPFWTTVARSVEDVANQAGFSVFLCNTDESVTKQDAYLRALLEKRVDGVLLVPAQTDAGLIPWLQGQNTPVVVLDRRVSHRQVDAVRCDSEDGAVMLVNHLLDLGHRRIAVLGGPPAVSTSVDRVAGYRRAMAAAGIDVPAEWVCYGQFTQASGYEMAHDLLRLDPRPTALLGVNNFIALGAWRAAKEAGLRVPRDLSLVAFDDFASAFVAEPFLTVVDQPAAEMGRRAAELLLARLQADAPPDYQELVLPVHVIVRSSTAPPPDQVGD